MQAWIRLAVENGDEALLFFTFKLEKKYLRFTYTATARKLIDIDRSKLQTHYSLTRVITPPIIEISGDLRAAMLDRELWKKTWRVFDRGSPKGKKEKKKKKRVMLRTAW